MKTNKACAYGIYAVLTALVFFALALSGCPGEPETPPADQTPTAADFTVSGTGNVTYDGEPHAVTVTAKAGKTGGAITVKYEGANGATSITAPSKVAAYTVTFDVAAAAGWTAASGLAAGTLTIDADPEHTHSYPATWSYNAAQHWHECACGEKADIADHSGDPCGVCGYQTGNPDPDPCECNGKAEDCECADCDCETCEPETTPPAAHAGEDFEHDINEGASITLNGSGTSEGTITAYAWSCTKYPTGADEPTFSDIAAAKPTVNGFTKLGEYEFTLKVTDNNGTESQPDVVKVTVYRMATATIEVPSIAFSTGSTILDFTQAYTGYNSDYPNGCITYKLTDDNGASYDRQVDATALPYSSGTDITFTQTFYYGNQAVAIRNIRVMVGINNFGAIHDGTNWQPNGTIPVVNISLSEKITEGDTYQTGSNAPAAHAGEDQTATLAHDLTITLDGTGSTGDITAYTWECASYTANQGTVQTPYTAAEVTALIANAGKATATVAPRKAGTYVFKLTVTDDDSGNDTDNVTVVVEPITLAVNLANFDLSASVLTSLNLTPNIDSAWSNLISVTLNETDEDGNATNYYNITENTVSIRDGFTGHSWPPPPRITQNFIYAGEEIGSFYFNLRAVSSSGVYRFTQIYKWDETLGPYTSFPNDWAPALIINEVE